MIDSKKNKIGVLNYGTVDISKIDRPTLLVTRSVDDLSFVIVNQLWDYEAVEAYNKLIGNKTSKKPVGDLHSVPHYRCPSCFGAVVMYDKDPHYPCCQWCGQKLDWNDDKSYETEEILLVDDLFPNGYGIQHQKPLKISFKGEEE